MCIRDRKGTTLGDFRVELDSLPLKKEKYKHYLEKVGAGARLTGVVEDVLESIVSTFVPAEIVTAPIAIADAPRLESLRWALHARNAEGTKASILYTFGFQLNPELPALDADTLVRHLRAFLALQDWLFAVSEVDATRDFYGWTEPFPVAYRRKVLDPSYTPDEDALIGDYLEANPTRNRALDMLPVFATLQEERVLAAAKEAENVKARPTFHYRLPNCQIDDPAWTFALEWNRWIEVEKLADDPARMRIAADELLAAPEGESPSRELTMERARRWGIEAP